MGFRTAEHNLLLHLHVTATHNMRLLTTRYSLDCLVVTFQLKYIQTKLLIYSTNYIVYSSKKNRQIDALAGDTILFLNLELFC
jgi:hypothetical protein